MDIEKNVLNLNLCIDALKKENRISREITVVAATKYVKAPEMTELYKSGIINMGENKVMDFLDKYEEIKDLDITWHFIGSLQTNKVRKMINLVSYLHSLDRISLAEEINKSRRDVLNCFVEVNCSGEDNKHGINEADVKSFIYSLEKYDKIKVIGLMTMAANTEDESVIHQTFAKLRAHRDEIASLCLPYAPCTELSMGMSHDYKIAIQEGATFVRIGSLLFK